MSSPALEGIIGMQLEPFQPRCRGSLEASLAVALPDLHLPAGDGLPSPFSNHQLIFISAVFPGKRISKYIKKNI